MLKLNNSQADSFPLGRQGRAKHEIISCERCAGGFECKSNSGAKCQCNTVQLNINEMQYVSEMYDSCLCAKCLFELQQEYRNTLK